MRRMAFRTFNLSVIAAAVCYAGNILHCSLKAALPLLIVLMLESPSLAQESKYQDAHGNYNFHAEYTAVPPPPGAVWFECSTVVSASTGPAAPVGGRGQSWIAVDPEVQFLAFYDPRTRELQRAFDVKVSHALVEGYVIEMVANEANSSATISINRISPYFIFDMKNFESGNMSYHARIEGKCEKTRAQPVGGGQQF